MHNVTKLSLVLLLTLPVSARQNSQPRIHVGAVNTMHSSDSQYAYRKSPLPPKQNEYALSQNFPNPFRRETAIDFELPRPSYVTIRVYDSRGILVRTLISETESAGGHRVMWDGKNHWGQRVIVGSYYYRIEAEDFHAEKRMQLAI